MQTSIAAELSADNLCEVYEVAEDFHANVLARRCILFALEHFDECAGAMKPKDFGALLTRMAPQLRASLTEQLRKCGAEGADLAAAPAAAQPNQAVAS